MKGMLSASLGWPAANSSGVLQHEAQQSGWVQEGARAANRAQPLTGTCHA